MIFLIITLVQFIVITKGAERVAEVAARFTLDAMPGKQMSIDADLRAGIIDFQQARARREGLARESQFYGAMDGAMKFVKGDAIASMVITLINIVGGLDHRRGDARHDGHGRRPNLFHPHHRRRPGVADPGAADLDLGRHGGDQGGFREQGLNLGKDVASQILGQPKAIAVASGLLTVMALIPGLPKIPFFMLAAVTGSLAYGLFRAEKLQAAAREEPAHLAQARRAEELQLTITVPLVLQVSEALTPFVDIETEAGRGFYERLVSVRNSLYYELGVMFPPIQIKGNSPGESGSYTIWADEVPVVSGQTRMDAVLVNDSAKNIFIFGIKGEDTANPATGKPAAWVTHDQAERARAAGLQVWETPEVLLLHLTHYLKKSAREFIGIQEVQVMVSGLKQVPPHAGRGDRPQPVSLQTLTEILQRLVEEEVSVRDLKAIFQVLCEWGRNERDVLALTEQVRAGLRRKICYQVSQGRPLLFVHQLDPEIEEMFRNSIRQSASGPICQWTRK